MLRREHVIAAETTQEEGHFYPSCALPGMGRVERPLRLFKYLLETLRSQLGVANVETGDDP